MKLANQKQIAFGWKTHQNGKQNFIYLFCPGGF